MEQWSSGYDTGLPNQRSQVRNHKVAENLHQISSFKVQSNKYQGFLGTWWLKVSSHSDSVDYRQLNYIHKEVH